MKHKDKQLNVYARYAVIGPATMTDMDRCVRDHVTNLDRLRDAGVNGKQLMPWNLHHLNGQGLPEELAKHFANAHQTRFEGFAEHHDGSVFGEDCSEFFRAHNALFAVARRFSDARIRRNREEISQMGRDAYKKRRVLCPGEIRYVADSDITNEELPKWATTVLKSSWYHAASWPHSDDPLSEYKLPVLNKHPHTLIAFAWMLLVCGGISPGEYFAAVRRFDVMDNLVACTSKTEVADYWTPFFGVHRIDWSALMDLVGPVQPIKSRHQGLPKHWLNVGEEYEAWYFRPVFGDSVEEAILQMRDWGYGFDEAQAFFDPTASFVPRMYIDPGLMRQAGYEEMSIRLLFDHIPQLVATVYGKARPNPMRRK